MARIPDVEIERLKKSNAGGKLCGHGRQFVLEKFALVVRGSRKRTPVRNGGGVAEAATDFFDDAGRTARRNGMTPERPACRGLGY